jgi:hypothetical protein
MNRVCGETHRTCPCNARVLYSGMTVDALTTKEGAK